MRIHATIDDNLFAQASEVSGLRNAQAVVELALRMLVDARGGAPDVAGRLSRYARPELSFADERKLAWDKGPDSI